MNNLAIMLDQGRDLPRDAAEAHSLWQQSAALGHVNAMFNLGLSFLEGSGASADPREGMRWIKRAAQAGQPNAQTWLRQKGYDGPLPPPVDWAATIVPTVRNAAGQTKVCGAPIA
jgi:TPR repeat protein